MPEYSNRVRDEDDGLSVVAMWAVRRRRGGTQTSNKLAFTPGENSVFAFDTGVMQGRLRGEDARRPVCRVLDLPSSQAVSGSNGASGLTPCFRTGNVTATPGGSGRAKRSGIRMDR